MGAEQAYEGVTLQHSAALQMIEEGERYLKELRPEPSIPHIAAPDAPVPDEVAIMEFPVMGELNGSPNYEFVDALQDAFLGGVHPAELNRARGRRSAREAALLLASNVWAQATVATLTPEARHELGQIFEINSVKWSNQDN